MKYRNIVTTLLFSTALGAVFIYAGFKKVISPAEYARAIASFRLLSDALIHPLALSLPILEVIGGLLLFPAKTRRLGAYLVGTLMLVFLFGLIQAKSRGIAATCGCFGSGSESIEVAILRDIVFLSVAAWIWYQSCEWETADERG